MSDNKLDLKVHDKLVLLALDDEKGTFVSDSMIFGYCIAGAILFELSIKGRIQIVEDRVKVIEDEKLNDEALDYCLKLITDSKKERKMSYWVETIGFKDNLLRKKILDKLISLDILEEKENRILWIFKNNKYPTKNEVPENLIRKRLNDIILNASKAMNDEIMIISLVDTCGLNNEVYGKAIANLKKTEIKRIIKDYQFADTTGKLIEEIHDTIIAVLVVIIATTAITSTTN